MFVSAHSKECFDCSSARHEMLASRKRRTRKRVLLVVVQLFVVGLSIIATVSIVGKITLHPREEYTLSDSETSTLLQKQSINHLFLGRSLLRAKRDSPLRGEQSSYSQYIGYHARERNGQTEADRAFYGYPQDEEPPPKSWLELKYEETNLLDVWMCWMLAVAWSSWMFGSFVKSELLRYGQDSITVRGNVRMVTLEEASLGTGIPIYKAVIDYMIPAQLCNGQYDNPAQYPPSGTPYPTTSHPSSTSGTRELSEEDDTLNTSRPALQIRKEFETMHPLQQGFGNVELLVLHHEPTTSIIKEDWEQQLMEQMEESRSRRNSKRECCGCVSIFCRCIDGVFCGFGKDAYGERLIWKRIWIGFCLLMILLAMAGSVLAVHRLPADTQRLGWLCLCLESLLILPTGIGIRLALTCLQRSVLPPGRAGVVVSNSPTFSSTPTMKNLQNQNPGLAWGENAANNDNHFCMDPSEVLDVQVCEEDEVLSLQQTRELHQHQQTGDQEYVVRLPNFQRDASDLSDMSNTSHHSVRLNPVGSQGDEDSGDSNKSIKGPGVENGVLA